MKKYKYIKTENIDQYEDWEIVKIIPRSENANAFCMAVIMKEDISELDKLTEDKDKDKDKEITINFTGITDYLRDKDIEIEYLRKMLQGEIKQKHCLQNIIDKATNYYLKTLSKNGSMPDEAVEMFNLLEGNK